MLCMLNLNRTSLRIFHPSSSSSPDIHSVRRRSSPPLRSGINDRCVAQSTNQLGNTTATTCGTTATDTTGCTVNSASDVSYGAGFAAGGGGVYVCEFASDGIRIWFFAVCPLSFFPSHVPLPLPLLLIF
jgi:hypothetical protein